MAGPHVGARQGEQAVQLVAGVAHQPAHRLVFPALRVVLDGPHVQTNQLGDCVDDLTRISQVPERGPGHVGTDLLVTDERRFPVAQLVDRGFPDVVQQRRQSRNQLRRSEGRGEQRVAEDVVAMPAPLLHPLTGLELWQDARQEAGRIEQLQAALRLLRDQQLRKLVADPLHGDRRRLEPSRLLANRAFDRGIEREPKGCREADRAQHAERVFVERRPRIERRHDPARL